MTGTVYVVEIEDFTTDQFGNVISLRYVSDIHLV